MRKYTVRGDIDLDMKPSEWVAKVRLRIEDEYLRTMGDPKFVRMTYPEEMELRHVERKKPYFTAVVYADSEKQTLYLGPFQLTLVDALEELAAIKEVTHDRD